MTHPSDPFIVIAKIGATSGIEGWIKIESFSEHPKDVFNYSPWYYQTSPNVYDIFPLEKYREHANSLQIKIQSIHTPESARHFTGQFIYIKRSHLKPLSDTEFYWVDLIGCVVKNIHQQDLGTVIDLMSAPAHDILLVNFQGKQHAIPFRIPEVVHSVDLNKKEIIVDWEVL